MSVDLEKILRPVDHPIPPFPPKWMTLAGGEPSDRAAGDSSVPAYEWAPNRSGTELATVTPPGFNITVADANDNPNPRCNSDEVLPLDANNSRSSYREIGLQFVDHVVANHQLELHFG